jgi:hypothetical protein
MARRMMWTLENGPGGSTSQLLNHRRVEAHTLLLNEADPRWDNEWTATRPIHTGVPEWRSSLGKTSGEFLEAAKAADTRADRNRLEDLARRAAAEEREHVKRERFLDKARRYSDRSRFRCIGTPLLLQDERHSMSLRSNSSLSMTRKQRPVLGPNSATPEVALGRTAHFAPQSRPLTAQGVNLPRIYN